MNKSDLSSILNTVLSLKPSTAIRLLLMVLFVSITPIVSFGQSQTFSSSGTFVAPAGVTSVTVECWGAGGAGGMNNDDFSNGGGGGGGAYRKTTNVSVVAGTSYTITVGAGGVPSVNNGNAGNTSAILATTVTANGGKGGTNGQPGQGGAGGAAGTLKGGDGADGLNLNYGGGGGASGGTGAAGISAANANGASAVTGGGAGGNGAGISGGNGSFGGFPGGGGGGGRSSSTGVFYSGGNGGNGQVKISWTCPTYSITSVSVSPTPVCSGSTTAVTLNSSPAGLPVGIYTVTYNAGLSTGLATAMTVKTAGIGSFTSAVLSTPGSNIIKITNLASGSCSTNVNTSTTVTVNPVVKITLGANPTITQGTTSANLPYTANNAAQYYVTFDATAVAAGFTSSQSGNLSGASGNIVLQVPYCPGAGAGTYSGTLYVGTFSPNCTSTTYPFSVTIASLPAPSGTALQSFCVGTTVANLVPNPGGASSIKWYDAAIGGNLLTSGTALTTATHYYASQTPAGCESTARLDVTVTITPAASIASVTGTSPLCIGGTATYLANTVVLGGGTGAWSSSNTAVATVSTSGLVTGVTAGTADIIYTITGGCGGTKSAKKTVTINSNLTASVAIAASPSTSICYGTSVTFTATPTNGGTTPVYQWRLNGVNVGTNATTYANATLVNGDVITCVMTSNATSCLTGSPATSNAVTITLLGPPATGVTICAGGSGSLTSSASCGSSATVGLNNAGVTAGQSGNGTGDSWSNRSRIVSDNDSYVSSDINNSSRELYTSTYGFSIPSNATITGVQVVIGRYAENSNSLHDNKVNLRYSGSEIATNKASSSYWPTSEAAATYGSSSDVWGATLTPAIINDNTFGVVLDVDNDNNNNRIAFVDYVQISVTYIVSGSLDWFTVSSGGTKIGSGSPFNPVGVSGSGLANTNTPGTTTYFAECSSNPGCRTPVDFVINAAPVAPTVTITSPTCSANTGTITITAPTAVGMTYSIDGIDYTNTTGVFTLVPTGTYNVTAKLNATCASSATVADMKIQTNTWTVTAGIGSWSAGTPNSTQKLVFTGNYPPAGDPNVNITGCSCMITGGAAVIIKSGKTLTITNEVTVVGGGTLTFEDTASLVQINNAAINSGDITYKRITAPIRQTDYTYWSSPVKPITGSGYQLGSIAISQNYLSYDSTVTNDWKYENASKEMTNGIGYAIQGPGTMAGTPYLASFVGVPNNGNVTVPVIFTNPLNLLPTDPNYGVSYLLGNPYPSAINADTFLSTNSSILDGTLYFWTHYTEIGLGTTNLGSGALAFTSDDYASYNYTGGVSGIGYAAPTIGLSAIAKDIPTGKIAAGQGFFATSIATGNVVFNNIMRLAGTTLADKTGTNQQFFKTKNPDTKTTSIIEKHRVWLNLSNTQGAFKQTLIGYVTDATNDYDSRFDGESFDGNEFVDFYSINQDKNLVIQGRALPFDENDEVPLGFRSTIEGSFTINIDQVDGSLANQAVFIEDKLTNTVFDLKGGNYTFNTLAGTFNDRFVLRYTNKTLGTNDLVTQSNQVLISVKNKEIKINSFSETIDKVTIYDVLGRQIYQNGNVNSNEFLITNLVSSHQTLIVKTSLQNGKTVTDKIIY